MRFGSVCSGIEAASVAWEPLGWSAAWFSEIEPFPCALLKHKYPAVPNHGDMSTLPSRILSGEVEAPDLLCGGTPCQAFSVAGLRKSLTDARGNLSLIFCEVADAIDLVRRRRGEKPAVIFWENVPGVLTTKDNAFGCFLAGLAGEDGPLQPSGAKWTDSGLVLGPTRAIAWRTLDAQHFQLAQRRKRLFIVSSAREDIHPAEILFEREGVRRDFAPSRKARQIAPTIPSRSTAGGGLGTDFDCDGGLIAIGSGSDPHTMSTLCATDADKWGSNQWVNDGKAIISHAFGARQSDVGQYGDLSGARDTDGHSVDILQRTTVRRLTPRECERLQGFPDDYTAIPYKNKPAADCPDGPRYKALGNSWAVPVVRWIGNRILQSTR